MKCMPGIFIGKSVSQRDQVYWPKCMPIIFEHNTIAAEDAAHHNPDRPRLYYPKHSLPVVVLPIRGALVACPGEKASR
ncbi:hypothetical protein GCM10007052_00570 [Halioglobus japonicus]|nr:hypothetical protein GCM10007052_00570 [Halioglobus japonicus]